MTRLDLPSHCPRALLSDRPLWEFDLALITQSSTAPFPVVFPPLLVRHHPPLFIRSCVWRHCIIFRSEERTLSWWKICEQKDPQSILLDVIKSNARKLARKLISRISPLSPLSKFSSSLQTWFSIGEFWNFELHGFLTIIFLFLFLFYILCKLRNEVKFKWIEIYICIYSCLFLLMAIE